jgi:hypothetical protein
MSYDEEQHKRSRVVIETPTARREVVQTTTARTPDRRGISTGVVAALVIGSIALVTILFLFILNRQNTDTAINANARTTATPIQQPVIVQQPAPVQQQQPPIIIQQPATTTSQPPVIINQSAPPATSTDTASRPSGTDDSAIQSAIDKKMAEDATLSTAAVTATVSGGKVTLIGTADTRAIKDQAERLVKSIRGVKSVDNQIVVSGG